MPLVIAETYDTVGRSVEFLKDCPIIYFDIETTGLDPYTTALLLVSIHGSDLSGYSFTFVYDVLKLGVEVLDVLKPIFEHPGIIKVAHNAVFDWKHLYHHGDIYTSPVYCTMIAEQVIKSGLLFSGFGLDDVAERRLGVKMDKSIRKNFIDRDTSMAFSEDELIYSGNDVAYLEPIYQQQQKEIAREHFERVLDVECKLIPITAQLEYNGICINEPKLRESGPVVEKIIKHAEQRLQDEIILAEAADEITFDRNGYSAVNVGSPKQMLGVFNQMGIDVQSLGKKELSDWDATWAKKNAKQGMVLDDDDFDIGYAHPVLNQHAVRTAAAKLKGTYVDGLLERINPVTRRIHPGFKQCGAVSTGRMSSVSPKLGL